ncbi:MAG TPA: metalloregulator ArsR/SmtB family transcription factor [Verrucomicrobiales bacterium]|jgi:ArsR family transcriptional regulator|nr:metalloregulator ArsR/SmtB family transcription factor [Verrucomicrobiales bacterium]
MTQTLKCLKALGDATRVRLVALLERDELSVNELQQITRLGQSRISTHLGLLQEVGLLTSRKDGKRNFYRINPNAPAEASACLKIALTGAPEIPEHAADLTHLKRVLAERNDQAKLYFNQVAGRFDRQYGPGRSWQAFAQTLLRLLPRLDIADLGSGEGLQAELLARNARRVICVDNSKRIVDFGQRKAKKNGLKNLEFRHGDIENPPLRAKSVDVALLSQALHHAEHPKTAIAAAHRILRPGGRILILDLLEHNFEQARELYGDRWLGFPQNKLHEWLKAAKFRQIEITEVAREEEPPHFQTVLATAVK